MSYSDWLITALVVAAVLFAAWRVGQKNPTSTGKLARDVRLLEQKVAEQGVRLDGFGAQLDAVERSVIRVADEVGSMGTQMSAIRMELAADRGLTERTWASVSRLEGYFIEDSFKQRGVR
ncbi:hypothetical protein [Sphingomonas sp.]|uniref:hypothetical protein n=1 Tax=Sphingomonas sp. TaxID=28214 RepID=UPI003CC67813